VQLLLDEGAVPIGKANLDQFATGLVGTRSPYGACSSAASPAHISGGSSSGSAVAVARGLVPLALGTDTAGSGRVPAAFNGLVGVKPTRGVVSNRGLMPACRSLDCVTTLTRTVAEARQVLGVLSHYDPEDPWARSAPSVPPAGVARQMRVVGVPSSNLDLDPLHRSAWMAAVAHAGGLGLHLVEVDISPFLQVAQLLYSGPWVSERYAAFGYLLEPDGPHLDPTVRQIVLSGKTTTGSDVFEGLDLLATLRRAAEPVWDDIDALLLPVTPGHPLLSEVAADPVGVNSRLGTYTNFVNLLDLCAVAVPAGNRPDGLPFGVQLIAPAFADAPLVDLADLWCTGTRPALPARPGRTLVAVAGAHLSGLPLNHQLVGLGGQLHSRARTSPGYRMYRLATGPVARPALVWTGTGPPEGLPLELWDLPDQGVGALLALIDAPLGLGRLTLHDRREVTGFVAVGAVEGNDITADGGWRGHLRRATP
jgi:allophanate hydrolase